MFWATAGLRSPNCSLEGEHVQILGVVGYLAFREQALCSWAGLGCWFRIRCVKACRGLEASAEGILKYLKKIYIINIVVSL